MNDQDEYVHYYIVNFTICGTDSANDVDLIWYDKRKH